MNDPLFFIERLRGNAFTMPHKAAYVLMGEGAQEESRISNAELYARVVSLSLYLRGEITPGQRVLLMYQDSLEFIVAFLACLYSGIIAVPVAYQRTRKTAGGLAEIAGDSAAAAVLTSDELVVPVKGLMSGYPEGLRPILIPTSGLMGSAAAVANVLPLCWDIAFIQYTSGSTGRPRGVIISQENLLHNQSMIQDSFDCRESSVILSWLPFHHDMGLIGNILHAIYTGCTCVLMSPFQFMQRPRRWLEGISHYKATHSGAPNFGYDLCVEKVSVADLPGLDLSSWKVAYNGSEFVKKETLDRFAGHFVSTGFRREALRPCYGLAESTLLVSCAVGGMVENCVSGGRELVSCGRPPAGVDCRVLLPGGGESCGELQTGEICISGASVTRGYWNDNERKSHITMDGREFFRTGDLGFFYKDQLFIHGRLKEMMIVRGVNVYPYDIEDAVSKLRPEIQTNAVVVFSVGEDDAVVVAELKRGMSDPAVLREMIGAIDRMVTGNFGLRPADIVLVSLYSIPRTSSGKLRRVACREKYMNKTFAPLASKQSLTPDTPAGRDQGVLEDVLEHGGEEHIRRYVLDILRAEGIGLPPLAEGDDPDLVLLGLDSIRTMQLINILGRELSIPMTLAEILYSPTLSGLVDTICSRLWLRRVKPTGTKIIL